MTDRDEDEQGNQHGDHRDDEGKVHARVIHAEIVLAEVGEILRSAREVLGQQIQIVHVVAFHGSHEELVAQARQVRIVHQVLGLQEPVADDGGHERRDHAADVDEHIENLEAVVPLFLGVGQGLGTLLGRLGLEIVIQLAHDGLKVSFEETVTAGDEQQGQHGEEEHPGLGTVGTEHRDGQEAIADGHHDDARDDGLLVVLRAVRDDAARQGEDVDQEIEHAEDQCRPLVGDTELGADEQHQHGIHDVVAEPLAHVAQSGGNQALRMLFPGLGQVEDQERNDNDEDHEEHHQGPVILPQSC